MTNTQSKILAELAKEGLRPANLEAGEPGWYATVNVGSESVLKIVKVWATKDTSK